MSEPRHINTNGSRAAGSGAGRKINRAPSGRASGGYSSSGSASRSGYSSSGSASRSGYSPSASGRSSASYSSGSRGGYSASSAHGGAYGAGGSPAPRRSAKKRKKRTPVWLPLVVVLCIIAGAAGTALGYVRGVFAAITPDSGATQIADEVKTAPEFSGDVVGILVGGIDYESTRSYGQNEEGYNDGMTDMILYFQFDVKNGKVNMLQIPRNTLVGASVTGATGKTYKASNYQINSIMKSNSDGMAALADFIAGSYKLPVDYYATIDMDALKEVVDRFGGIDVYIPETISSGGSTLQSGYHRLMGNQVEFLVRNRHSYNDGDISRLNMQRYFYAALFKRVRTANLAEIWHLLPVFTYYVKTDMPADTIVALAYKFLSVDSANIMVCQTPMYSGDQYKGNSILVPDRADIADLLNTYFRTYTQPVDASSLDLADDLVGTYGSPTSANVQFMGQLDTQADTAIANGETDLPDASVSG